MFDDKVVVDKIDEDDVVVVVVENDIDNDGANDVDADDRFEIIYKTLETNFSHKK